MTERHGGDDLGARHAALPRAHGELAADGVQPLAHVAQTDAATRVVRQRLAQATRERVALAAGGVEAIFSALAIRDNVIPPTINLDNPGEGCDLDFVPHTARQTPVDIVLSNSFGFGGTNGTLVFRRI